MSDKILIEYNQYKNKAVININCPYFNDIREHFSVANKAAKFSKRKIPKRKYIISQVGDFGIGFVWEVYKYLKNKYNSDVIFSKELIEKLDNKITFPIVGGLKYPMRYYQKDAIEKSFNVGGGLTIIGTGGGKTLVFAYMCESIFSADSDCKIFILVPDIQLVKQTFDLFTEYGCSFSFSKWTGNDELNLETNVIIANAAIITSQVDVKWMRNYSYLLYDEVHKFSTNENIPEIAKIIKRIDFKHKFGFTGSLPNYDFSKWLIFEYFGKINYVKSAGELIDENFVSNVDIQMVKFLHNIQYRNLYKFDNTTHATEDYIIEMEYVFKSDFRNKYIKKIISSLEKNTLILVERLEQGFNLEQMFSEIPGKQVFFIRGELDTIERKRIIDIIESSNNVICIAMSKIFSTGISINNIHYLMFVYLGKSWVKVIQSIGRGLRLHENKNKLVIFDFYDSLLYSQLHGNQRKEIYTKQGISYYETKIKEKTDT